MARIFTTSFVFNNLRYDAIVTVIAREDQWNFSVRILESESLRFLPKGQISYSGSRGFERLESLNNTIAQSLMRCVSNAIRKHMRQTA